MKVEYIGTLDDDTDTITVFGVTFEKGKVVTVADDHPRAAKFLHNSTFSVTGAGNVKEPEPSQAAETLALIAATEPDIGEMLLAPLPLAPTTKARKTA